MKLGNRIRRIVKIDSERYRVKVEFHDGFRETVDLRFLFRARETRASGAGDLRGQLFAKCFVESGALAWPNGYELCPDAVRKWIEEQKRERAA
jgi:hypothetical protein